MRIPARVEAPDGSAWVELFPIEIFYWLQPVPAPVPVGARNLGMIHAPNVRVGDALRRFVIAPARGKRPGPKIVSSRAGYGLAERAAGPAGNGWSRPGAERPQTPANHSYPWSSQ